MRSAHRNPWLVATLLSGLLVALSLSLPFSGQTDGRERAKRVVLDAGHGGADYGAKGASGALEKKIALDLTKRIGEALEKQGIQVVYTRTTDEFVSLAKRTELANESKADLFVSVHANASRDRSASGPETFFLSLDASDEEARALAIAENQAFEAEELGPNSDILASILGDMSRTENLRASSQVASAIQREFERLPGRSRGVKQAPFVVLMHVNMPAVLLETGFITNPTEEARLRSKKHQRAIASGVARAIARVDLGEGVASK